MKKLLLSTILASLAAHPSLAQIAMPGPMMPPRLNSGGSGDISSMTARANNGTAGGRTLGAIVGDVLNIKNGSNTAAGAKGDGVTDDTAAIQAVETAACNAVGTNPSGFAVLNAYVGVYWPPGQYYLSGVDFCPQVANFTSGLGSVTVFLKNGANRSVFRVLNLPSNFNSEYSLFTQSVISGFNIFGNAANQTDGIACVEAQDDPFVGPGVRREASFFLKDMFIIRCKGDGVYNGTDRNAPFIDNVTTQDTGGSGWHQAANSFDGFITDSGFGLATGSGIQLDSGAGCVQIENTSAWLNTVAGVNIQSGFGCYFSSVGGSFDDNYGPAVIDASTAPVTMTSPHFSNNNYGNIGGTNPTILYSAAGALRINSPAMSNDNTKGQPTYFIQSTGAGAGSAVIVTGASIANGPDVPWSIAQYSAPNVYAGTALYGYGTNSPGTDYQVAGGISTGSANGGDFVVNRTPAGTAGAGLNASIENLRIKASNGSMNLTTAAQFSGYLLNRDVSGDNAAGLINCDSNGDGGWLLLSEGGVRNISLTGSSCGNYINKNTTFGSTASAAAAIDNYGSTILRSTLQLTGVPFSGTAAASACFDASGNLFKKTTTGPCL